MKKFAAITLAMLLLVVASTVAFAEFVPSIGEKPAPRILSCSIDCEDENPIKIVPISDPDASDDLKDLYKELQEKGTDDLPTDLSDPIIKDLFEVLPNCDHADDFFDEENELEITLDLGADENEELDILGYVNGAWRSLPARNNGDGTYTVTLTEFGVLAVLASNRSLPVTGDANTSTFLWVSLMVVSLALIPVLSTVYLKNNRKANSTEE